MESCNNKYISSRNNNIYVHTSSRSVRYNCNGQCNGLSAGDTNVCGDRKYLSERSGSTFTGSVHCSNNRSIESCNNKYISSRNNNIYVHTSSRSVRYNCNGQCNG